ncbi:BRCT domain-containing protein [Dryocola sp. LX212]
MSGKIFVYVDSKKNVSIQHIHDIAENDIYIQGISLLPQDEGKFKSFRKDRVVTELNSFPPDPPKAISTVNPHNYSSKRIKSEIFDICFTGFKKEIRTELETLATNNDMVVRKSVANNLQVLCCGENAGPTKIKTARNNNTIIVNEEAFINLLLTGEIEDQEI